MKSMKKIGEEKIMRRLKMRFMWINFFAIFIVLCSVLLGVYFVTAGQTNRQNERTLEKRIRDIANMSKAEAEGTLYRRNAPNEERNSTSSQKSPQNSFSLPPSPIPFASEADLPNGGPVELPGNGGMQGDNKRMGLIALRLDLNGRLLQNHSFHTSLSDEELQELASLCFESKPGKERISYQDISYRFLMEEGENGEYHLALLDDSPENATMKTLLVVCLTTGLVSLLIVLLISSLLASRAIAPVERSWKRQKEFLADAAHELKTPLTVIKSNVEIMKMNGDEKVSSQQKWLDYINQDVDSMANLVNDLLFLAGSDAQTSLNTMEKINISELLEECFMQFEPIFYESGLQVDAAIEEHLSIMTDPGRVRQLIRILLDNVVQHAEEKSKGQLILQGKGAKVVMAIGNECKKMAQEDLNKLFDRFYRAEASRVQQREQKSYGLGLSIAKVIVEESRGSIKALQKDGMFFIIVEWNRVHSKE